MQPDEEAKALYQTFNIPKEQPFIHLRDLGQVTNFYGLR